MTKREMKRWKKKVESKKSGKDRLLNDCTYHFIDDNGVSGLLIVYNPDNLVIGPLMDHTEFNLIHFGDEVYELRAIDEKDGAIIRDSNNGITHMTTEDFIQWVVRKALDAMESGQIMSVADLMDKESA